MRRFGPSGSGTCHCPIQSYYLPVPRDLPATNQCTFHHRSWATGATLEGNYKWNWPKGTTSQQPWPAKRTSKVRCGLVPSPQTTTHHGRDLRTSILSGAWIQTFEGAFLVLQSTKNIVQTLLVDEAHLCQRFIMVT